MGPSIPGYRLTNELFRSARSRVYRGLREADQRPVVLKTINQDYPDPYEIARLRREHRILAELEISGVPRTYGLAPWDNNLALVFEDLGDALLSRQYGAGRPMPLDEFFKLAIGCARVLSELHRHVIHKDLNPANILWDARSEAVYFIGFGLASAITRERHELDAPKRLEGALAFISPEQTGRMNRDVDFRTDFYSLGVSFYLLLTGQLPFTAADPGEWIYCHITRSARPPHALRPELPPVLSRLVLKLMAKNPEDRYQSARGLLRDLIACQGQSEANGQIADFPLGQDDVMAQFQVPQRLYGRDGEVRTILEAFRGAAQGESQLVTVAGQAGIGKSALVRVVCQAIVERHGRFIEGKFDQFQRHLPYAAIAQAFEGLVKQLLAEPEERLLGWKQRLEETLGPNGRIAVDLVPGLAGLIGEPPPLVPLHPTEEQNRFLATMQSLITVFARPEHPLVLFLDDLQWSDWHSLVLLRVLLEAREDNALLVIGAFRDNEVTPGHPLTLALSDIEKIRRVHALALGPLDAETINRLVADALQSGLNETLALSSLVHGKTDGNPFFAGELLRTLHQDGLIAFDHEAVRWRWDLEGIARAEISDDIVDFMVTRIQRLAPETQSQLRQAACIGRTFDLRLLSRLANQSLATTTIAIWPAIAAGLIAPLDAEHLMLASAADETSAFPVRCQFLHDRVRQAAYALIPQAECQVIHLALGRILLAQTPEAEREAHASAIAQQLNIGRSLLATQAERLEVARLNGLAARKAKESAAYRAAFEFTRMARELLPPRVWDDDFELAFALLKLHASCAQLTGEFAVAETCYAELLGRTRNALERAEVHAMRAAQYIFANRMDDAIDEGVRALALLGVKLAAQPGMATVGQELVRTKLAQGFRQATELDEAPLLDDPATRLKMRILVDFIVPSYLTGNDRLFATTALKQAKLSLRHGNSVESVSAYQSYAVLLAGLGDLEGAYAFGQLALRLTEKFHVIDAKCRTYVLYTLFSHAWSQPWSTFEHWFKAAIEAGLQSGDFVFMAFACGWVHLWDPQVDLRTAVDEGRKYLAICKQTGYQNAYHASMCHHQYQRALLGETAGALSMSDAGFDETVCVKRMEEARYVSGLAIYRLMKLQLVCLHGEWAIAWETLGRTEPVIKALAGSPYMVDYCVSGFLASVRRAAQGGPDGRRAKRRARRFYRQMGKWARHCPDNFAHHLALMEAELARLADRRDQAPALYQAAIARARQAGFVRDEARASELAGHYYHDIGIPRVAIAYWRDARDGYARWGATTKVDALERLLPEAARAVRPWLPSDAAGVHLGLVPQLVESGMLDLATIWKATQAISGEPSFERLIEKLLAIVKQSAGAQKGVLVLRAKSGAGAFVVQAESLESGELRLLRGEPLDDHSDLPVSLIRYVIRARTSVVLTQAASQGNFMQDPYIQARRPLSLLALPIIHQSDLLGALYLENNLLSDAFTPERLSVLQILAGQAAISLQNLEAAEHAAYLEAEQTIKDTYARELEARVDERTAELKQAYERLKELDRLKTSFLNVVSHELRTPLTSIIGFAELIEGELSPDPSEHGRTLDFLTQIRDGSMRLGRLVNDLLDFARMEAGILKLDCRHDDLAPVIARVIESLRPQLEHARLTLALEMPVQALEGHFDAARLEQVLLNLLGNAIKFTPAEGRIVVRVRPSEREVSIEVRDSGIGIEPSELPKLFQKFYQVDTSPTRAKGGVGLGLSIAHSIVEAHGGRIGVDSTPGLGSTFWFSVPLEATPFSVAREAQAH